MIKEFSIPEAYVCQKKEWIPEVNSEGYILEHKKTGAGVILLANEDKNKVFAISFRTPPSDDTGVPHILEHSVLCGSRKFALKDPFVQMLKGSLQTFLNAMTYPDKTIYPVASCNDKDFANLMDVYLDAVFYPRLYENENIFLQEGWRYEIHDPEEPLTRNGVVYNEMKGAYSSADEILNRNVQGMLYPDTPYAFESGGDPDAIPNLTYEQFCNFHKKYYHPSNSYIIMAGDMNMEERLEFLDREYLSAFDRMEIDSALPLQQPFKEMHKSVKSYSVEAEESVQQKTYLSLQWSVGDIRDAVLCKAMDVLDSVLISSPGAPLRQALLEAGIGRDVSGGYGAWGLQPGFCVTAREAEEEQAESFVRTVRETLQKQADQGINRKSLLSTINNFEFRSREADFGGYPKGLIYAMDIMDSWLYDGEDPFAHLKYEDIYRFLKEQIGTGYYEDLIRKYFLNNPHAGLLILKPQAGLEDEKQALAEQQLQAYKESLTAEELEKLIGKTKGLEAYQSQEDSEEAIAALPHLSRDDIGREARKIVNETEENAYCHMVHRECFTGGIGYGALYFGLDSISREEIPWVGLLRYMLGMVSTDHYEYGDLYDEIYTYIGGFGVSLSVFRQITGDSWKPYMTVSFKSLYKNIARTMELLEEVLLHTRFDDDKRLAEVIAQYKSETRQEMMESGHTLAIGRGVSYGSQAALFQEMTSGIDFYRFAAELDENFEARKEEIKERLAAVCRKIFTQGQIYVNYTAEEGSHLDDFKKELFPLIAKLPEAGDAVFSMPEPVCRNEGFRTSGAVQYVAEVGSYAKAGPYTGVLRVLSGILRTEYLWQNIRVKGGAYGAMCGFQMNGESYFASYRDPHIRRTLDVYEGLPEYLRNLDMTEEELDNAVIAAIGTLDRPLGPAAEGDGDFRCYMSGVTQNMICRDREQVLDCTQEDLRGMAAYMQAILDCRRICAVGSSAKIDEAKDVFGTTENLFR